jgi:invasion protein IalB
VLPNFKVTQTPVTKGKLVISALGTSVTKKLTVKRVIVLKKATVKKSAKKLVLTATLKKVNGKYLKGKKITFKFNGKKYTAKTDKKGIAKVTIKSNILKKLKVGKKVTYQATYLKDTVKKTVKVQR